MSTTKFSLDKMRIAVSREKKWDGSISTRPYEIES